MFEQDYVMRLIKEMVRAVLKMLFNIDTESPQAELLEDKEEKATLDILLDKIDHGDIDEAENRIFEIAENQNKKDLKMILLFFSYLDEKTDEFLEEHNFSRRELKEDLKYIMSKYGLDSISGLFFR